MILKYISKYEAGYALILFWFPLIAYEELIIRINQLSHNHTGLFHKCFSSTNSKITIQERHNYDSRN